MATPTAPVATIDSPKLKADLGAKLAKLADRWAQVIADFGAGASAAHAAAGHEPPMTVDVQEAINRLGGIVGSIRAVENRLGSPPADYVAKAWVDLLGVDPDAVLAVLCLLWEKAASAAAALEVSASRRAESLKAAYDAGEITLDQLDARLPKAETDAAEAARRLQLLRFDPQLLAKQQAAALDRFGGVDAVAALVKDARAWLGEEAPSAPAARSAQAEADDLAARMKRVGASSPLAKLHKPRQAEAAARAKKLADEAAAEPDAAAKAFVQAVADGDPQASGSLRALAERLPEGFPDGFSEAFGRPMELSEERLRGALAIALGE